MGLRYKSRINAGYMPTRNFLPAPVAALPSLLTKSWVRTLLHHPE